MKVASKKWLDRRDNTVFGESARKGSKILIVRTHTLEGLTTGREKVITAKNMKSGMPMFPDHY